MQVKNKKEEGITRVSRRDYGGGAILSKQSLALSFISLRIYIHIHTYIYIICVLYLFIFTYYGNIDELFK